MPDRPEGVPGWFRALAVGGAAAVGAVGTIGTLAAIPGWFHLQLVVPVAGLAAAAVTLAAVHRLPSRERAPGAGGAAWAVVAMAVVMTVLHLVAGGERILTTRDPGAYYTTGRWLARSHELVADPVVGAFDDPAVDTGTALGWFPDADGRLTPQFVHLEAAVLATAQGLGGDRAMLAVSAVIGGFALLAVHLLGSRWLPPWWSALGVGALAIQMPQSFLSREPFSELPLQLLLAVGLALLVDARTRLARLHPHPVAAGPGATAHEAAGAGGALDRAGRAGASRAGRAIRADQAGRAGRAGAGRAGAGLPLDRELIAVLRPALAGALLAGCGFVARIDALVPLGAVVLWAAVLFAASRSWYARRARHAAAALAAVTVAGLAPGLATGALDLVLRSRPYVRIHRADVVSMAAGFGAACVGAAAVAAVGPAVLRVWRDRAGERAHRLRAAIGVAAGGAVVVGALLAYFVRPHVQVTSEDADPSMEFFQRAFGLAIEPTRRYYEYSAHWLEWYVGPVALAAAVVVLAWCVARVVGRRADAGGLGLAVTVFTLPTALYGWRARAFPDHLWVTRRFVPVTFPGLALAAAAAAWWLWSRGERRLQVAAGALAVAMVAAPAWAMRPVVMGHEQGGMLGAVHEMCDGLGDGGAALVTPALAHTLPQTLRAFCGVPAAAAIEGVTDRAAVERLSDEWAAEGRTLWVIGTTPESVVELTGATFTADLSILDTRQLGQGMQRRPSQYIRQPWKFFVGRVPSIAPAAGG